jgi:hypothetical protein
MILKSRDGGGERSSQEIGLIAQPLKYCTLKERRQLRVIERERRKRRAEKRRIGSESGIRKGFGD